MLKPHSNKFKSTPINSKIEIDTSFKMYSQSIINMLLFKRNQQYHQYQ